MNLQGRKLSYQTRKLLDESLGKALVTPDNAVARAQYKVDRLKAKGWTRRDFARVLVGGPKMQKPVSDEVKQRAAIKAEGSIDQLIPPPPVAEHCGTCPCPKCGHVNKKGVMRCIKCGASTKPE